MSAELWLWAGAGLAALVAAVAHLVIVWGRRVRTEPRPEVIDTRVADRLAAGYDLAQAELEERARNEERAGVEDLKLWVRRLDQNVAELYETRVVREDLQLLEVVHVGQRELHVDDMERLQNVWAGDFDRLEGRICQLEMERDSLAGQLEGRIRQLEMERDSLAERVTLLETLRLEGRPRKQPLVDVEVSLLPPAFPVAAFPVAAFPGQNLCPGQLSDEHMLLRSATEERF